jgi:hypothetical protein
MNFIEPTLSELCSLTIPVTGAVPSGNKTGVFIIMGLSMLALIIILYKTGNYLNSKITQQLKNQQS